MQRVIPRDLFNDGNLLTNYGHLYIALKANNLESKLINEYPEKQFQIVQSIDGDTYISNIYIQSKYNEKIELYRPLNSRESLSLYFIDIDEDTHKALDTDEDGKIILSKELMSELI